MLLMMVGVLVVLLFLRVPVAFSLLMPSLIYFTIEGRTAINVLVQQTIAGVNSFPLLAVPLFILLGNVVNITGIADRLFEAATAVFGRVRGSLGYVNVFTSFAFAWMSGAALGDAAALGKVQVPAMVRRGYSEGFTVGVTASAALIAPIIPPSIPAIILAVTASISVGSLFIAAIVPGLLLVAVLCLCVWVYARKREDLRLPRTPMGERVRTAASGIPALGAGVIILGGILGGIVTPTEAAAAGVAYMLVLALLYKQLGWGNIKAILTTTVETVGAVLLIVAPAALFGWILAREQAPQKAAELITSFTTDPIVFLILVNILLLFIGALIDPVAAILILVPVLWPVAMVMQIDPMQFGMIIVFNLMLGLLTPPVGLVLFVLSNVTNIPVKRIIKGVVPFYFPLLGVLALVTAVPALTTWLPGLLGF
ncbi:TRAP transporter large permease [Ruicaihuangia caeni]|uniref:TRAP transporter large permease n=1 Tax=Ruicaihuangia caeni TaxID=3042517 RepID=A0AAW6T9A0_9MICO|nr:TRAP transporter large permease [Klugiella sp. YN-L-19]MDI2098923.1 TRAP transporter large permease [Klugiella sp. YN-L-19]